MSAYMAERDAVCVSPSVGRLRSNFDCVVFLDKAREVCVERDMNVSLQETLLLSRRVSECNRDEPSSQQIRADTSTDSFSLDVCSSTIKKLHPWNWLECDLLLLVL